MMKFKPSKSYDGLLRQARAMANVIHNMEEINSVYSKRDYSLSEDRLNELEKSLQSEREMNSILTEELERMNKKP